MLIKQLYTICNTCSEPRLVAAENELQRLVHHGKLPKQEAGRSAPSLALARSGEWLQAEREYFRIAQEQVRRGTLR